MATNKALSGVIGYFNDPHALLAATEKVRDANYPAFDTFTPFPIHGLEHAQGLRRSIIPWAAMPMVAVRLPRRMFSASLRARHRRSRGAPMRASDRRASN